MTWKPRVVVAAVIEKDNKFLVVEEQIDGRRAINQPAGHLEPNETIVEAVIRETLEETRWEFEPSDLLGVMHLLNEDTKRIFIRFTFTGKLIKHHPGYKLDPDITQVHWMSYDEIVSQQELMWRSPLVVRSLDAYLSGVRYPLDLVETMDASQPCLNHNASLLESQAE